MKKLILLSFWALSSCTTVLLGSENKLLSPPNPDPVKLAKPVCLKLEFQTDDLDLVSDPEGIRPMDKRRVRDVISGLDHYNIITDCPNPVADLTVTIGNRTKNTWFQLVKLTLSAATLTIIPYYANEEWSLSVSETNNQSGVQTSYNRRVLTTVFIFPKWYSDNKRSIELYKQETLRSYDSRLLAAAIVEALKKKGISYHAP